ncbi:MAG: aldolase [Alphaproteobacteria bacterium]
MNIAKSEIEDKVRQDINRFIALPAWSEKQKLALTARILAREGHLSGLAGQITVRADDGKTIWTLPIATGFDEATAGAMLRVDDDMKVVEGHGVPNPAVRFHLWVYRARPDVRSIVHTHPPYCNALSMTGKGLEVAHMDAAMFWDDCAYLGEWPGVPVADDEGEMIAGALGKKRAIILSNHGQLCTGATVQEACYLGVNIERAARMQVRALAVGPIKPVKAEHAKGAHDFLLKPEIVDASFFYFARQALAADGDACLS